MSDTGEPEFTQTLIKDGQTQTIIKPKLSGSSSSKGIDVSTKLIAWVLGGVGTLLIYSAYKTENPMKILQGIRGEKFYVPPGGHIGDDPRPYDPNAPGDIPRLRRIASREQKPDLVAIPGGGMLDKSAATSLSRINKKLGYTVTNVGAYRTFAYQAALYASDQSRYGSPYTSMHVVGLALDVHADYAYRPEVVAAFTQQGWHRVRADEPWHWSYGVIG